MRHRWYDPAIGRFLSEDPIGIRGGIDPYLFARNDPINGNDPWGLIPPRCQIHGQYDRAKYPAGPPRDPNDWEWYKVDFCWSVGDLDGDEVLRFVEELQRRWARKKSGGRTLTPCEQSRLENDIPAIDLRSTVIFERKPPWPFSLAFSVFGYDAITLGNRIYFNGEGWKSIDLLGHELVHVGQYRRGLGVLDFLREGALHGGHNTSPYEVEADLVRDRIRGKGTPGC
jgi:hypothetical protein